MKIAICIKSLENTAGGAERVALLIASGLAEKGHDVTLFTFDRSDADSFYNFSPKICWRKLSLGKAHRKTTPIRFLRSLLLLRREILINKPDIAVGFMHSMFVPLTFSLINSKVPIIASEHIVPDYYSSRKLEFLALIASGFFVRKITVLSPSVRALYPKILQGKMAIIPNPVLPAVCETEKTAKKNVILNVGRLDPQKDQKTLIKAFASLASEFPDWSLRIVGQGELKDELEKLVKNFNLADRITLLGKTRYICTEYAKASIFALPSLYESFGLATAEALSFGLPAIGFADCPGTNELIQNGYNGILLQSGERSQTMAEGLRRLMTSEEDRKALGANGPASIEKYHPDFIINLWEDMLTQAL